MTRRSYDPEQKDAAVALANSVGLAAAAFQLDIPKSTIKTWAVKADVPVASEAIMAQTQSATAMSIAARQKKIAEAKDALTEKLADLALRAVDVQMDMLQGQVLNRLDHVVGAGTRAIHDLQLLEGNATEIVEDLDVASMARLRDELQQRLDGPTTA